jgi:hypothetical protein
MVASALTSKEVDDGAQVGFLVVQIPSPPFAPDGAYDQEWRLCRSRRPTHDSGGGCAAVPHGGPERYGCDRVYTARPLPPVHRRESSRMAWPKTIGYNRRPICIAARQRALFIFGRLGQAGPERRLTTSGARGLALFNRST